MIGFRWINVRRRYILEDFPMYDFLIGAAFVLMVVGPAIVATLQRAKPRDLNSEMD